MSLKITHAEKKIGCFELRLAGRLDSESSPRFLSMVNMLFESPVHSVQLNFRDLEYVSSAGLSVILHTMKLAHAAGATFTAVEMQAPVKKVFEIVQIIPMESIFASVQEADAYFDTMQKRTRQQSGG